MITAAAFALAAAVGALARAGAGHRWNRHDGLALGTLAVNLSGSFLLGLLADVGPPGLTVLGVGALGAFTTFSSFARDTVALAEHGRPALTGLYVGLSVAGGMAAAWLGMAAVGAA